MVIQAQIVPDLGAGEPRRRAPRLEADADVSMRALGCTAVAARLINISSHGFMAETDACIEQGVRVWLTLPGLPRMNALIIWARGGRLGGEFLTPIDPLAVFQVIGQNVTSAQD
jgi:hypothetical protein